MANGSVSGAPAVVDVKILPFEDGAEWVQTPLFALGELMNAAARSMPLPACLALAAWALGAMAAAPASLADQISVVVVGDVGLNPGQQTVDPRGVFKRGGFQPWSDTLSLIGGDIDGDINFMNLETVITDRNDLMPDSKGQSAPFNFRTHPNGLKYLVSKGFNVISLANNHSMDFGIPGLQETLADVGALRGHGVLAASGIGMNREEASRPQVFDVKGATVAFNAIGIVTNDLERHRATADRPGQIAYRFDDDFHEVLRRLTAARAALRILSIHYGYEGKVLADDLQRAQYRDEAALRDGIDIVVGHHAHVVRGVEMAGHSVIFYGLGNFLHHGTADMTHNPICKDYGLMARIHLRRSAVGRLDIRAVEAIPVTDTHFRPRRLIGEQGAARIHVLNYLAGTLDDGRNRGLRFTPQGDGSGLYCVPGAAEDGGRIGALCRNYSPPPPIPIAVQSQIVAACNP
jgi:poly-gamma-glutamate capsule biosynthesis protein CapA/YwtB (metallophosphatase superfamily)